MRLQPIIKERQIAMMTYSPKYTLYMLKATFERDMSEFSYCTYNFMNLQYLLLPMEQLTSTLACDVHGTQKGVVIDVLYR